jgi:hypothetical protein
VLAVFEREICAVIGPFPVRNVLGYVLATLVMGAWIPVFTVFAAMHILRAVGAGVCPLHFNTIKINLVIAFKAEMMPCFCFWYVHL